MRVDGPTSEARGRRWRLPAIVAILLAGLVPVACGGDSDEPADSRPPSEAGEPREPGPERAELEFARLAGITTAEEFTPFGDEGLGRWRSAVPAVEDVRIPSSADDHRQPALWLPPTEGDGPRPLLVVLHSWSTPYRQHIGIPFARWAAEHDWAMIHPNFRGVFETPDATGSDLVVSDVLDAIDFAAERADIDERRVFAIGFSGGGMVSLLMGGRHPDRFAGIVSWVPVYDLVDWFEHNRDNQPDEAYADQIAASCGGDPTTSQAAREECERRSPSDRLDAARDAELPVYIGAGLDDPNVPPDHALRAFNQLAAPADRLAPGVVEGAAENRLPSRLRGTTDAEHFFGDPDPDVLFARRSGPVTLAVFDGEHDMIYHPGLEWMTRLP